jgi:hypothetical protein
MNVRHIPLFALLLLLTGGLVLAGFAGICADDRGDQSQPIGTEAEELLEEDVEEDFSAGNPYDFSGCLMLSEESMLCAALCSGVVLFSTVDGLSTARSVWPLPLRI